MTAHNYWIYLLLPCSSSSRPHVHLLCSFIFQVQAQPLICTKHHSPKQSAVTTKPHLSPKQKYSQTLGKDRKEIIRWTQVQVPILDKLCKWFKPGIYKQHFFFCISLYTHIPSSATSAGRAVQNDLIKKKHTRAEAGKKTKNVLQTARTLKETNTQIHITKCLQTHLFAKNWIYLIKNKTYNLKFIFSFSNKQDSVASVSVSLYDS